MLRFTLWKARGPSFTGRDVLIEENSKELWSWIWARVKMGSRLKLQSKETDVSKWGTKELPWKCGLQRGDGKSVDWKELQLLTSDSDEVVHEEA